MTAVLPNSMFHVFMFSTLDRERTKLFNNLFLFFLNAVITRVNAPLLAEIHPDEPMGAELSFHENFVSCRLLHLPLTCLPKALQSTWSSDPNETLLSVPERRSVQAPSLLNPHRVLMSAFKKLEATIKVNRYGPRRAAGFKY